MSKIAPQDWNDPTPPSPPTKTALTKMRNDLITEIKTMVAANGKPMGYEEIGNRLLKDHRPKTKHFNVIDLIKEVDLEWHPPVAEEIE